MGDGHNNSPLTGMDIDTRMPTNISREIIDDGRRWTYRAEGHTSLVVANLTEKIVYRLSKRKCKRKENAKITYETMRQKLQHGINFVHHVMMPLIGPHLVQVGSLIELQPGFADRINSAVAELRPGYRKCQEVDPNCACAVRLPDQCLIRGANSADHLPTYSLEIKSKWGFMPDPIHIEEPHRVKRSVCRFCLHQYLKVETGKWDQRSLYCPINLYSGNHKRMKNALQSLFKTPQNNIRMFKDGVALFGDDVQDINMTEHIPHFPPSDSSEDGSNSDLSGFIDVVIKCLLHVSAGSTDHAYFPEQRCVRGQPCLDGPAGPGLPRACALGRVMHAQKLDCLDIERIYPLYVRVREHLQTHPEDRRNWNLDGPFSAQCWDMSNSSRETEDDGSVEFAVLKIRQYLVSRTAKDCSIMVAIQPLTHDDLAALGNSDQQTLDQVVTMPSGAAYRFSIGVIDLDPKPWDKIEHYFREDSQIIAYHERFLSQGISEYLRAPFTKKLDAGCATNREKVNERQPNENHNNGEDVPHTPSNDRS